MYDYDSDKLPPVGQRHCALESFATRIFIVKVASRCNLACTYCYMYAHADQSWRLQPRFMSEQTVRDLGRRLEEHAQRIAPVSMMVVAHGGEPLLYPSLDFFFERLARVVQSTRLEFAIQTNGTLLDEKNLEVLKRHSVHIGVSVDGTRDAHNRVRITAKGKGSFDDVVRGIALARARAPHLMHSVLQVIDPSVEPSEMLDTLQTYGVERADLLFPDLNHDTIYASGLRPGEIGEWLVKVFDDWICRPDGVHIRLFMTIAELLLGSTRGTDQIGAMADGALMIETDGSYHFYDALKTTFPGAGCTEMNLTNDPVYVVEAASTARAFRDKASAACRDCLRCRLFSVCGGGNPIHRYSKKSGFDGPSVYCLDLTLLIDHIQHCLDRVEKSLC